MRRSPLPVRLLRNFTTTTTSTSSLGSTSRIVDGGSGHADKTGGGGDGDGRHQTFGSKGDETGSSGTRGPHSPDSIRSWELHSYKDVKINGGNGSGPDLQMAITTRLPIIRTPTDVLVCVKAASVNPIDVAMTKGYGQAAINFLRGVEASTNHWTTIPPPDLFGLFRKNDRIEFPLILGRDFAGVVTQTGHQVKDLAVGDEVYGVCGIQNSGSHSDCVVTSSQMVRRKPKNLTFVEAASLPYVGLTSWSAIRVTGGFQNLQNKKFLVLGGSGGVGSFLIQYLKAHGSFVVSTCSSDALPLLHDFGCDLAVNYKETGYASQIRQSSPFDCIVDLTGSPRQSELISLLKPGFGQYITLSPPFLSNIDKFGVCAGLARNLNDIVWENWKSFQSKGVPTKWAFFVPMGCALEKFTTLAELGKITPVIQEVFTFDNLPAAYKKLEEGHARGKLVIDFQNHII